VHDNIASFGGDPTRIMLFGESAGGGSTSAHLVNPRSWPYFSRAGMQSGAWADWTAEPYAIAKERLPEFAANLNCSAAADVLACMRAVDYNAVLAADDGSITQAFLEWGPTIDGVEILEDPRNLLLAGKVAPVPILFGFNAAEGTLFNFNSPNMTAAQYPQAVVDVVGAVMALDILPVYPLADFPSPWWAVTDILSESQMVCPGQKSAHRLVNATARPVNPGVFVYYYTHVLDLTKLIESIRGVPMGAFHGSELAMVFNSLPFLLWGSGEEETAKLFGRYWSRFAATGNPNGDVDPTWPEFGASKQIAMIDTNPTAATYNVTLIESVESGRCAFWFDYSVSPAAIWGN
jgi:para-nitrobenzyl esterase